MFGSQPYVPVVENPVPTLEEARKQAVKNSEKYHLKNKILYDKKFVSADLIPGELVLLEIAWHPNKKKLAPVFEGPYTILRKVSAVNYEIDRAVPTLNRQTDIVHASKLRRYRRPSDFQLVGG
ncbi:unnamed protein product, partial [Ixodes hexagonus]